MQQLAPVLPSPYFLRSALGLEDPAELHVSLAHHHRARLAPGAGAGEADFETQLEEDATMARRERAFLESERARVAWRAAEAPRSPEAFVTWFELLRETGPGQGDVLFPWLAERASLSDARWFLTQEVAGEAGFDDLVAMTQVKLPTIAKLELARNYWDEMGRGTAGGMHGPMLERLARALDLEPAIETTVWESLALGNLMVGLARNRSYAWHSVGALGVVELTAPWRAERVNAALRRLDVPGEARQYFALHATLDVKHSEAWNREVIGPLVAEVPEAARAIAEGALMRLEAGARCFRRYRRELWQ